MYAPKTAIIHISRAKRIAERKVKIKDILLEDIIKLSVYRCEPVCSLDWYPHDGNEVKVGYVGHVI